MKILHDRLVVSFTDHNQIATIGDTKIELIHEWLYQKEDSNFDKQENLNYLESKPQIAIVTHNNPKYPYKVGDKLFLHYMAHTTAHYANESTKEAFIYAHYVFFTFMPDGTYKMADNVHFGKQVYTEDEKTPSGIIINALGNAPKLCQIELTHVPENSEFEVGETVLSVDANQYIATIDKERYVMLRENEIVGRLTNAEI